MKPKKSKQILKDVIKEIGRFFCKPLFHILTAYWLLFIAFIMVIEDNHCAASSSWFHENFTPSFSLDSSTHRNIAQV